MLATTHLLYCYIAIQLFYYNSNFEENIIAKLIKRDRILYLKALLSDLFGDVPDINISTFKVHFVDHIAENGFLFRRLHFLHSSPFERFKCNIKSFIGQTAFRQHSTMEKALALLNTSDGDEESGRVCEGRNSLAKLFWDRIWATPAYIGSSASSCSTQPNRDARNALRFQNLKIVQKPFHLLDYKYLLCDLGTTIIKLAFIDGESNITFKFYIKRHGRIKKISRSLGVCGSLHISCLWPI